MRVRQRVNQQFSPAVSGRMDAGIERWFTELDTTANQFFRASETIALTGDFRIEVALAPTDDGSFHQIFGGFGDGHENTTTINLRGGNGIAFVFGDGTWEVFGSGSVLFEFEQWNALKIQRSGQTVTVILNGNSVVFDLGRDGVFEIDLFGGWAGFGTSSPFNGLIGSCQIWSEEVLVFDVPFDQPIPNDGIIKNRAAGNPGAPEYVTAVNLTASASQQWRYVSGGWQNSGWPNMLTHSNELSQWERQPNVTVSPDGDRWLYSIAESTGRALDQHVSISIGVPHTFSFEILPLVDTTIKVRTRGISGVDVEQIFYVFQADGWRRIEFTFVEDSEDRYIGFYDLSGQTGDRFFVRNFQLEESGAATKYVATDAVAGRRMEVAS